MKSIIGYPIDHPFPIQNLPYGSFCTSGETSNQRCGVAIGDYILDLQALSYTKFFPEVVTRDTFSGVSNATMALAKMRIACG